MRPMAVLRPSTVRSAALRSRALSLAKAFSIDGVDGSCSRRRVRHSHDVVVLSRGAIHVRACYGRYRPRKERLPDSWGSMRRVGFSYAASFAEVSCWPFFQKRPRCLIGMEACAGSHDWGRRLQEMGHDVRLMPPSYVKPYVKRGKTDAADAAAICEAVTRPSMRFVAIKSEACSSILVLHRTRDFLVRQRTQIGNAIRAHMTEFGVIFEGKGPITPIV
jgi:Transposase